MPNAAETARILFANRRNLVGLGAYSEEDTVSHLIDPALAFLGYPVTHQRRELQSGDNRPDIVLYDAPAALAGSRPSAVILEAKPLKHDLSGRGVPRSRRPQNQIRRYLNADHPGGPGTYGILTDGNVWRILRRGGPNENLALVAEWNLLDDTEETCADRLDEIRRALISPPAPVVAVPSRRRPKNQDAREICAAVARGDSARNLLQRLVGKAGLSKIPPGGIAMSAKAAQLESEFWREYAYAEAGRIRAEQGDASSESVCVAVIRAAVDPDEPDAVLYREDVAIAAAAFAKAVPLKMSVVLITQPDENGEPAAARLAVHYQGHTDMTTDFNPHTPAPKTLNAIQRVRDQLNRKTPVAADTLVDAVAAKTVRKEFFEKIANGWTLRQQRKAAGGDARRRAYREAILRHLIRSIFVWILKEDGKLPPEAFDEAFARREAPGAYHADILSFLFHERLNKTPDERAPHPSAAVHDALADARFLNGSLFARHRHDDLVELDDDDYFGADPESPGLFTILSEYDWTSSEHTPYSSDQTIDPEVLGNLFENLIAATHYGDELPDRMPAGTYYTPADVALEMVKDALAEAVLPSAPSGWTRADLRALFGGEDEFSPETGSDTNAALAARDRRRLIARVRDLAIYDPAAGSGEFPFLCALAVRGALRKLGVSESDAAITRDIISRQLFAQDINPMAAQVARLRLFIAIIAAEDGAADASEYPPLPNLEARIVCADTLATVADPQWSPFGQNGAGRPLSNTAELTVETAEVSRALAAVAAIREKWQSAHNESDKRAIRRQDQDARKALRDVLKGGFANPETIEFANHALLDPDAPHAETDPRLLFYNPERRGFDVVIGNPPYEKINKSLQPPANATRTECRALAKRREDMRKQLTNQKRYQTIAGGDLYNLIAEASLALARPDGGVVTLIVPLSLCFRQDKRTLRRLFEERCSRIALRPSDNRPDKIFHDSPVAHSENRVRATIITATRGGETAIVQTSGANRWRKSERHEYLASRPHPVTLRRNVTGDERLDSQWERLPTPEISDLIAAMRDEKIKIANLSGVAENDCELGFPLSVRYFITTLPAGILDRGEKTLPIANRESLELAVAAANNHVAYAWWRAYGDAFHVNPYEISSIAVPRRWLDDAETGAEVRRLARALIAAAQDPANTTRRVSGTRGREIDSVNFHDCAPQTVARLDELYLESLNTDGAKLPVAALLPQLRALRSDSDWRLGVSDG